MPMYDYKCKSCGTEWEKSKSIDDRLDNCPHCGLAVNPRIAPVPSHWHTGGRTQRGKM